MTPFSTFCPKFCFQILRCNSNFSKQTSVYTFLSTLLEPINDSNVKITLEFCFLTLGYYPNHCNRTLAPASYTSAIYEVATEWESLKSWRQSKECSCGKLFDLSSSNLGINCHRCGNMRCQRCVSIRRSLPGHYSQRNVPICNKCHQDMESR